MVVVEVVVVVVYAPATVIIPQANDSDTFKLPGPTFDMIALVKSVGDPRHLGNNRSVVDITVLDGSTEASYGQELKWSFRMDMPPSTQDTATMDILQHSTS